MVDLFSAQLFKWGVVHCDPHPGNIFIRRLANGKAQLVLIDHGLYAYMTPKFRHQYCTLWKALMTFDNKALQKVTSEWGLNSTDFFASATLLRPYEGGDDEESWSKIQGRKDLTAQEKHFEMQKRMKEGIRDLLANEDLWPKELLFMGRQMRIVQGNNQYLGSPVNRIKMMGEWASRSLYQDPGLPWGQRPAERVAARAIQDGAGSVGRCLLLFQAAAVARARRWDGGRDGASHEGDGAGDGHRAAGRRFQRVT